MEKIKDYDHTCFACGRYTAKPKQAQTMDCQIVWLGSDCFSKIHPMEGYQPPLGGPKVYWIGSKG